MVKTLYSILHRSLDLTVAINPNNKKYVNLKKELSKSNDTKN